MKNRKLLFWIAKVFISLFMFFSAYFSFTHAVDLRKLGFPDYFRIELVVAKCIGGLLLLIPQTSRWLQAGLEGRGLSFFWRFG